MSKLHLVVRRQIRVPLEAGALKILDGVLAPILDVDLPKLFRQREAKDLQASIGSPELFEASTQSMSGLSKVALAGLVSTHDRCEGGMPVVALGSPTTKMPKLHQPQLAVPLESHALEILHRSPIFNEHLTERVAKD